MMANLLETVVAIGIAIYGMRRLLVLRKYWQYRHEQVATESISVIARLLSLGAAFPFLIKFIFVDKNVLLTAKEVIDVTITGSILLIGTGLWIQANRGVNPIRLLIQSVNLERREALHIDENDETDKILARILQQLGKYSSESTKKFYDEFSSKWHISKLKINEAEADSILTFINDYLALKPSAEQVAHLKDLLSLITWSQDDDFDEISIIIEQLQNYINDEYQLYEVIIVPQSEDHHEELQNMLQSIPSQSRNGGAAYVLGKYHSRQIADAVSLLFIQQNLFSIVEATQA